MANDKAKPVQERIAAMFGRSGYSDPRDGGGGGGTSPSELRHTDVAAALGYVSREQGRVAALVLETCYGGTLTHERELSKAWEASQGIQTLNREAVVMTRFAGALAIRKLAGMTYSTTHYAEYAYLLFSRREVLQARVGDAGAWLQSIHDGAVGEFRRVMREHSVERVQRRLDRAA